jgi:hypothetical protein
MPIDTPYNRMVTDKYNALIRNKIDHEMETLQTVLPAPAGYDVNGYNPRSVGSGVGVYEKTNDYGGRTARGISATLCGMGEGGRNARGGNNLGLQPGVRVELALGAGLRGNRTSKHGCLDRHEEFNGSGKKDCPLGHEVCSCGGRNARGGILGTVYRGVTGRGEGGRNARGGRKAPPKKAPAKKAPPKKAVKKEEPKKEEPKKRTYAEFGSEVVKGAEDAVKGIEKAVEIGQKVAPYIEAAPEAAKSAYNTVKGWFGRGKRGVNKRHTHAEKERGVRASGKSSRAEIVKKIMKKMGKSMIEASKYVKEHNLY